MKKQKRFRSPAYLASVRQLPCCVCGATQGAAAHHITGMYGLSGMGLKAPDSFVMPACDPIYGHGRDCHQQIHADPGFQWMQPIWLVETINIGLERFTEGPIHDALQEALEFVREKTS